MMQGHGKQLPRGLSEAARAVTCSGGEWAAGLDLDLDDDACNGARIG